MNGGSCGDIYVDPVTLQMLLLSPVPLEYEHGDIKEGK